MLYFVDKFYCTLRRIRHFYFFCILFDLTDLAKTKFSKILDLRRFGDIQVCRQRGRKMLAYLDLGSER